MLDKMLIKTGALERTLDAALLRNEAISQNISNVDTPGYKRKTVSFEDALKGAISDSNFRGIRTDPRHIPIGNKNLSDVNIRITEDNSALKMRLDGNNVDIENEMAQMAKNTMKYNLLVDRVNSQFKKMKSVINEGR